MQWKFFSLAYQYGKQVCLFVPAMFDWVKRSALSLLEKYFCLIEVRAMVVAVLQPLAECTAIFTVCIVEHRPPPCAVTVHKTIAYQKANGFQDSVRIEDQRNKNDCV